MGTVDENREAWTNYDWDQGGEEWSAPWGGSAMQWWGVIYPRIRPFIGRGSILELAPGYGRFTQYLKDECESLTLVDLTGRCIEACKRRFEASANITYHVNDGKSLEMIPENSIDFAFSFDSLVHAESDVLQSYLLGLSKAFTSDGVGFIHHSNLAAFVDPMSGEVSTENKHWRATSVSAETFRGDCEAVGLCCFSQELVNWREATLTDCLSVFTRHGSAHARPFKRVEDGEFMKEAARLASIMELYWPTAERSR